ncbi:MAG: NAD(P)H-binding protein [Pseudomonadota bacterium]
MNILVIGATKGIGLRTCEAALVRGHSVRAFSRSAASIGISDERLDPFAGDALNPDDIARALAGMDAVIVTLGVRERLSMLWQTETLFSASAEVLLPAMAVAGVNRLLVVTGFGAGESKAAMSWPERAGHGFILGKPYADKDRQEALVRASDLDWTLVRPVILTNAKKVGAYRTLTDPKDWRNGLISRAEVADYLVRAAEDGRHVHQAVVLAR